MKLKKRIDFRFLSLLLVALLTLLAGCGGGGGDGSSATAQTGTVAIFIKDGPADQFEHIWVTISQVELLPVSGSPVVIYDNPSGCRIDILDYRNEDFLLKIRRDVPAGQYSKIRLRVSDIELSPVSTDTEVKLPSGKIDLNPREPFTVEPGGNLTIRLDIDANKAIHVHPSRPDRYIFRPVIFVDIVSGFPANMCPKIVHGTIDKLMQEGGQTAGFVMTLDDNRGTLDVKLNADTDIFLSYGEFGEASDLAVGQEVRVRGTMDSSGALVASLVVIGDVVDVLGDVVDLVSPSRFRLTTFSEEELLGTYEVVIDPVNTLVLTDCNTEVGPEAIQEGMVARVIGKLVGFELRAVAVILRTQEIKGVISTVGEPGVFTVALDEGGTADVQVTGSTPVFLEGDGTVSADYLTPGRRVRVLVDPASGTPFYTAVAVYIEGQKVQGTVQSIESNILLVNGLFVRVPAGATILDLRNEGHLSVTFGDIAVGDEVVYFGLSAAGVDYEAPVVLIVD